METSERKIRIPGVILVVTGLLLSGSMGWLIFWLQDVIAHPGAKSTWTGGLEFTAATFRLFYAILAFGMTALTAGVAQVATGRRNALVMAPLLVTIVWLSYSLWALLSLSNKL